MKPLLPIVFLVVLLFAAGTAWMLLGPAQGVEPARAGLREPAAEARSTGGPGAAVPDEAARALDAGGPLDGAESAPRQEADSLAFDPALARRVRGEVELPRGLPADELLVVRAYSSERDPTRRLLRARAADGEPLQPRAEAPVDALGAFEIALPPEADDLWLVLHARYLRAAPLELGQDDAPSSRFETELGAWITGNLRLPAGVTLDEEELAGLEVTWAPGDIGDFTQVARGARLDLEPRKVRVDADLGFEHTGVQAGTAGDLRVVPESLAAHKSARFEPHAGEHVLVDLPLSTGGSLSGRVVDDTGAPVAGAEIQAEIDPLMMGMGGFAVREGESSEDGSFELAAVLPGKLTLRAEAEGHLDHRSEVELSPGEARTGLVLEVELGQAIAGVVRWPDGSAAAEAAVEATFDLANMAGMGAFNAMRGPRGDATADAQGAFRITGLGKGPFSVKARAERDGGTWVARSDAVQPQTLDLVLELAEPLGVAGRVLDENGQPVSAFRVRAQEKTSGPIPGLGGQTVSDSFEDDQGRFRLEGLSQRTWTLVATGEGYGRGDPFEVALPTSADAAEIVLRLPHAATVSGSVLSPEGLPVAGAEISQQLGLQGLASLGTRGDAPPGAVSEADGSFVLAGLTPGAISLAATADGFAKSSAVPLELVPAQHLSDVVLTLRRGGRILGVVYAKDGSLLGGATVIAQNPTDLVGQRWDTSDADGAFLFENVTPGTWQVMTMPGQGALETMEDDNLAEFFSEMKFQMVEVLEGEDVHVELGGRPANPVAVSGRVLVDEQPQAGALVNFMQDGSETANAFKFTTTGKDGTYRIELDRPGGYLVQVQKLVGSTGQQQSVQLHRELPDEREVELDLHLPVGSISGLVRGPDGQPLADARVSLAVEGGVSNLTFGGGQYAEITTDANGRYQLVWLREGHYSVAAGGPLMGGLFGGSADAPARQVRAGIHVRDGQHVERIDFRLSGPGRLEGTVKDSAGKPVEGAAVFVRDENGQLLERISLAASDGAGRFTYAGIGAGKYLVHARSTTQVSAEAQVTIREGQATQVALTVDPGSILVIVLSDGDGNPVDCSVTVTDDEGRQVNGSWSMADLMGLFNSGAFTSKEQRVGPVPPGRYTIQASTSDGKSAAKRVSVSGQDERRVTLRLKD